jgi:hypothetical protein
MYSLFSVAIALQERFAHRVAKDGIFFGLKLIPQTDSKKAKMLS